MGPTFALYRPNGYGQHAGKPWPGGDSWPRWGTLANDEACTTSPGGQHDVRFDPRDFRIERVFPGHTDGAAPRGARLVRDEACGGYVYVLVLVPVISRAKADDHCAHPEANSATCENAERVALTQRFGSWFDRAVPNVD